MNEQKNILILRYLNGELSEEEKVVFEAQLSVDEDLHNTLLEYQRIVRVVQIKEREKLKSEIAAIGASVAPKDLEAYKPKYPPPSNSSSWIDIMKSLLFFTVVILIACLALIYFNQFPVEHPAVKKIREKIIHLDEQTTFKPDTIFQTIESEIILKDTTIYGKEELIEFLDELEEENIEEGRSEIINEEKAFD